MTTNPSPSQIERRGPTFSDRGMRRTSSCASSSSAATTSSGLTSADGSLVRVHRSVGAAHQLVGVSPVVRIHGDTSRDSNRYPPTENEQGRLGHGESVLDHAPHAG